MAPFTSMARLMMGILGNWVKEIAGAVNYAVKAVMRRLMSAVVVPHSANQGARQHLVMSFVSCASSTEWEQQAPRPAPVWEKG
jgi:hypothetical protein